MAALRPPASRRINSWFNARRSNPFHVVAVTGFTLFLIRNHDRPMTLSSELSARWEDVVTTLSLTTASISHGGV